MPTSTPRPGKRWPGSRDNRGGGAAEPAARHDARPPWRVRNDAVLVFPAWVGDRLCRGAGVPPDGGELSVLARPLHHSDGAAGCDGRDPVDAVRHTNDAECSVAHGIDHVDWRGNGQQHFAGHVRERRACGRAAGTGGDAVGRVRASASSADDRCGHGPGDVADGARSAKAPSRTRRSAVR